ncbi:DUF2470 domain-containing protein [Blastococcus tunisiensis]|uniref:DUF2470 domain-containing protein n=1 Tax=Blastococcus tunisiensis TaxID=1798228 RepID=A0A1I2ERF0_9ACTN|nr:DUF2470 domain-containing protein [Blastococcus sp. DSM 46838]SFE95038.1 hypothetical protein SAMN05216574_107152 [Blastococcus sp. DSM 46838]
MEEGTDVDSHELGLAARTGLHRATSGALTTFPRHAARPHLTNVAISACNDGSAVVLLRPDAPAAGHLRALPFAAVTVAAAGCPRVTLQGGAQRLPDTDQVGRVAYRVEPGTVRIGDDGMPVPIAAYIAARPALPDSAPAVLAHLRCPHHAEQLAACLRALGHDARFAEATELDGQGMTVVAADPTGVSRIRLTFPTPISRLEDLPADLYVLLTCRCGDRSRRGRR